MVPVVVGEVEVRGSGKVMRLISGKPALPCPALLLTLACHCTYSRPALGTYSALPPISPPASQHQRDSANHVNLFLVLDLRAFP